MNAAELKRFKLTKVYRETKRAKMITAILEGKSKARILRDLNISAKFYDNEIKRWNETMSISDRPRSGRPPKLDRINRELIDQILADETGRFSSITRVTNEYNRRIGERGTVSVSTMRTFWKMHGISVKK